MLHLLKYLLLLSICLNLVSCQGQTPKKQLNTLPIDLDTSMPFYYKMPQNLIAIDTSPAYKETGQKIVLTGTIYKADGKTPAPNTILYYYQTDVNGIYTVKENEDRNMPKNKLGQTHGYIRGWLKTDDAGKYAIYTLKPGTYPSRDEPAHIHITVKDKNMKEPYYIDDFVFDNDKLLTTEIRKRKQNRGGSGVIRFVEKDGQWIGERNIILGLNIPNYPKPKPNQLNSGKAIGEPILSFTPFHAYGADKGTKTCPICKYGWFHGVLYFVGNNPNWAEIKQWLAFLETESNKRDEYLKVYFIYGNEADYDKNISIQKLEELGMELDLEKVALTLVPSFSDIKSEIYFNEINPDVENTFIIYKRSTIIDKYVNLKPNHTNFNKITNRLDETINDYFKLSRPKNNASKTE